ncbi:MAG: hypothetical protein F4Z82_15955 [Caldilineaceae bacterium SB0668_bin_21]|nr:hypothetical protein [Caldilineaceae bacterium SB0668_bin_21]MYI35168.1 hypothetical protein [Acidimicrobiaceae bacterium]
MRVALGYGALLIALLAASVALAWLALNQPVPMTVVLTCGPIVGAVMLVSRLIPGRAPRDTVGAKVAFGTAALPLAFFSALLIYVQVFA